MATMSPNDLELALKKRARRRLVGAIALVLFMVIMLPLVLKDRAAVAPQETIKITMPADINVPEPLVQANITPVQPQADINVAADSVLSEPIKSEPPAFAEPDAREINNEKKLIAEAKISEDNKPVKKAEANTLEAKKPEFKKPEVKNPVVRESVIKETLIKEIPPKQSESKAASSSDESFSIQVGVFSDVANVKQLQAKLKQVGLDSRTENITTPKGEKIRLRAGRFNSRQEAAYALTKLQAVDLTGMVITN